MGIRSEAIQEEEKLKGKHEIWGIQTGLEE